MKKLLFSLVLLVGVLSFTFADALNTVALESDTTIESVETEECVVEGEKKVKLLGIKIGKTTVECRASNCELVQKCLEMLD